MDLLGWDTLFSMPLGKVNATLRANAAELPRNMVGANAPTDSVSFALDAACDAWQLEQSRSGTLFDLLVPFTSGTFAVLGGPSQDLTGVLVSVEVDLRWVPSQVPGSSDVAFSFPAPQSTKTGDVRSGGDHLDPTAAALLPYVVSQFLAAHAGAVTYVLATVQPAAPGRSWLAPKASAFTLLTGGGSGQPFLAILSAVTERDVSGLPRTVPPVLLTGGEAVFVLSQDLVLERLVAPAFARTFGVRADAIKLSPGHMLTVGGFALGDVTSGAITYHPQVRSLSSTIANDRLETTVTGDCDLKMNISMSFTVRTSSPLVFRPETQSVGFARDPSPQTKKDVTVPWYDYLLGPVADAVMSIIVAFIVGDLSDKINDAIEGGAALSDLPGIVAWTGFRSPRLSSARLENSLVLTGSF